MKSAAFEAIIDTGATNTTISTRVFEVLDMEKSDDVKLLSANGPIDVPLTRIDVELKGGLLFKNLEVPVSNLPEGVDALIGMDILTKCDFLLTNVNKTILQLRSPAIADGVCL